MQRPLWILSAAVTSNASSGFFRGSRRAATYGRFRSGHVPERLPSSSSPSEHASTMAATVSPNRVRISCSTAGPCPAGASSTASCSRAAIAWSSLPPCSSTSALTLIRCDTYGTREPLRMCCRWCREAYAKAASKRAVSGPDPISQRASRVVVISSFLSALGQDGGDDRFDVRRHGHAARGLLDRGVLRPHRVVLGVRVLLGLPVADDIDID